MRKKYVDISKAILILFVVLGHSGFQYQKFIYWFHMPAFFIISGYLVSPYSFDLKSVKKIFAKVVSFLIPYFAFFMLIGISYYLLEGFTLDTYPYAKELHRLLYGGRTLTGDRTVFWFITTLLMVNIIFFVNSAIASKIKSYGKYFVPALVGFLYVYAHLNSGAINEMVSEYDYFWSFPTLLLAIPYFYVGVYLKKVIDHIYASSTRVNISLLVSGVVSSVVVMLQVFNCVDYRLAIKSSVHNFMILDLLVPLAFTLVILFTAMKIERFDRFGLLAKIGTMSLVIMYLHPALDIWMGSWVNDNWLIYTVVGLVIPVLIGLISDRFNLTRTLFLGKSWAKQGGD